MDAVALYRKGMDVTLSDLRARLSEWVDRARSGDEILVTDWGVPVARLLGVDPAPLPDRRTAEGVINRVERTSRPKVTNRRRIPSTASVADLITGQRRWPQVTLVCFDAKALVKFVAGEDDRDLAASLWDECDSTLSRRPSYSEVRSPPAATRDRRIESPS
jgi:prevent-host-death family protein